MSVGRFWYVRFRNPGYVSWYACCSLGCNIVPCLWPPFVTKASEIVALWWSYDATFLEVHVVLRITAFIGEMYIVHTISHQIVHCTSDARPFDSDNNVLLLLFIIYDDKIQFLSLRMNL